MVRLVRDRKYVCTEIVSILFLEGTTSSKVPLLPLVAFHSKAQHQSHDHVGS